MIDFTKICARHDIQLRTYGDCPGLPGRDDMPRGLSTKFDGKALILYDGEQSEAAQQFTLAHELAHERLAHLDKPKRDASTVYGSEMWQEIEANIYAIVMLAVAELLAA